MMTVSIDLERLSRFEHAIINLVGDDGYPYSIPTEFQVTDNKEILLNRPMSPFPWTERLVGILFNHITAIPTGGYTNRRYMLVWGHLDEKGKKLLLHPEAISEWDEKILPFPELCARAAPQGKRYLENLQRQIEA